MILKGDAFDEKYKMVLEKENPISPNFIDELKKNQVQTIHYRRERLKMKKDVSKSMLNEKSMGNAMGIIDEIEANIRFFQQIDLEQDYSRFIIKRITDEKYIQKFSNTLGTKAPNYKPAAAAVTKD